MSPAKSLEGDERGSIIPVGGAEDKVGSPLILKPFVRICGGRDARIAVIPTASSLADTGERYEELFRDLGAKRVRHPRLRDAGPTARTPRLARPWRRRPGIFLTGGNQLRLATMLGGTSVARALRRLNAAACTWRAPRPARPSCREHMIAFGEEGVDPARRRSSRWRPGLGLTNRVVIDQHFRQRDRLGRLLTALAYNPFAHRLGLDEDTAAFIGPDDTLEVVGSGAHHHRRSRRTSSTRRWTRRRQASRSACSGSGCTSSIAGATFNLAHAARRTAPPAPLPAER